LYYKLSKQINKETRLNSLVFFIGIQTVEAGKITVALINFQELLNLSGKAET